MLLSLPDEIIHSICSLFCAHCCDLDGLPLEWRFVDDDNVLQYRHKQDATSLRCLVQTCTKLRAIAQPILYHAPIFYSYTRLTRTLLARPDLASAVRVYVYLLRMREYAWKCPSFAVHEDMSFMLETARDQGVVEDNASTNNLIFLPSDDKTTSQPVLATEVLVHRPRCADHIHIQLEWFDKLAEQTVLALLPNLAAVVVRVKDRSSWSNASSIPDYHFARIFPNPSKSWPLLHTLAMEHIWPTPPHIGVSMLRNHQELLERAPNLHRLVLSNVDRSGPWSRHLEPLPSLPFLDSVRQLVLHGAVVEYPNHPSPAPLPQTSHIAELMALCRNLDSISVNPRQPGICAWKSPSDFSPASCLQDLPAKTLRHLALFSSYVKIRQDVVQHGLDSLTSFEALQSLIIDEQCFCKHWLKDKEQAYSYEGPYMLDSESLTCLTDILPPHVTNLTVRLHDKYYAVDDVIELGQQVASGGFPELSTLSVIVVDEVKRKERYKYLDDAVLDSGKRREFFETVAEKQDDLQRKAWEWQREIMDAFTGTKVNVVVERVVEDVFSRELQAAVENAFYQ